MVSKGTQRHDAVLDALVQRLMQSGRYDRIYTKQEYYDGDHCVGEMDIVGLTKNHHIHIYEVKGNHNYKAYKHAREQLQRAYNNYNWVVTPKLIYHSPQKTKRLYISSV